MRSRRRRSEQAALLALLAQLRETTELNRQFSKQLNAANAGGMAAALATLGRQPVEVRIDGKTIASAVFKSKEFGGVIHSLTEHLVYPDDEDNEGDTPAAVSA